MVIIKQGNKRGRIGPSFRGQFYSYETDEGTVVKAWPKPRGKPRSEAQAIAQALFIDACKAMKAMDPSIIEYQRINSKGTPMLPRDALMAALYGRGPTFIFNGNIRRYAMATRVDMSGLIDNLGSDPGMLLYRGQSDLWEGLAAGGAGTVLTVDEAGNLEWVSRDEISVGGSGWYIAETDGNTSGFTFNAMGMLFRPAVDLKVSEVAGIVSALSGSTYKAVIVEVNASNVIIAKLAEASIPVIDDGTRRWFNASFTNPVNLQAFSWYALLIVRTDGTAVSPARVDTGTTPAASIPMVNKGIYARIQSLDPSVGETLTTNATGCYAVCFKG